MIILTFNDMPSPTKQSSSNWQYLVTVAFMAALGTIGVLVVTALRPTQDNSMLITTIIGFLSTTTGVILTFLKTQETHLSVNSRLDAFMASARQVGHMEGAEEGRRAGIIEGQLRVPMPMQAVIPVVLQPPAALPQPETASTPPSQVIK
jgi:hypothetical protein